MEDFKQFNLIFCDEKLNILIDKLNGVFLDKQKNFCQLCTTIYGILSYCKNLSYKVKCLNEGKIYYSSYDILEKFGFDRKHISRYKQCYEKFIEITDVGEKIKDVFYGFSPSKLMELLILSEKQLEKDIKSNKLTSEMSVKQIREYVKSLKGGEKEENKVLEECTSEENDEELEMAFDPKKWYKAEYYQAQSKAVLVSFCVELQDTVQNLLKRK